MIITCTYVTCQTTR